MVLATLVVVRLLAPVVTYIPVDSRRVQLYRVERDELVTRLQGLTVERYEPQHH